MERVFDADYLNCQLQKVMRKQFKSCIPEYRMTLHLLQEDASEDIEQLSEEFVKKEIDGVIYYKKITEIEDHRITSNGNRKKLYWIITGKENCKANVILAKVILDELIPKFCDMVLIEDLKDWKELDKMERKNKKKFFFGNLSNHSWLMDKYVETVIHINQLPDVVSLIQLSSMTYEKSLVKTKLFFSEETIPPDVPKAIYFCSESGKKDLIKYKNKNLRAVRKLMELSGARAGLWIHLPKYEIEGSILEESIKDKDIKKVLVEFEAPFVWSIKKNDEVILTYREGRYLIPVLQPEWDKYAELDRLKEFLIKSKMSDKVENICNAVKNVSEICQHGTSIIFMDKHKIVQEIDKRLSKYKRAFKVKEFSLLGDVEDIQQGIAIIDGALFSDFDGNCYAIGVIVDGKMVVKGDYGRGARYNSLKNYVTICRKNNPKEICIAVVMSEDGMINVI